MRIARRIVTLTCTALVVLASAGFACAEVKEVRISKGYGMSYMPLAIMEDQKLLERHAAELGLGDVTAKWLLIDGGSQVNDAMLSGAVDIAGTGLPGLVTLWARAKASPKTEVVALASLSSFSVYLNTRNPNVGSIKDFTASDKIAMPSIKTSLAAGLLQMAAAKEFGTESYAKLDPLTVSISQPEGMAALLSGASEITAHFTTPPFSYLELQDPKIHRVLNSVDVVGHTSLALAFSSRRFVEANPAIMRAFLAALDEADAFIRDHRDEAAEIFVRTSPIKIPLPLVRQIMDDPDTIYSSTPVGVLDFLRFMHKTGLIKIQPTSWKDLFVPEMQARDGS